MSREFKYFDCARCGERIPDFLTFSVGFPTRATYCLHHIPRLVRLRMWLREHFPDLPQLTPWRRK